MMDDSDFIIVSYYDIIREYMRLTNTSFYHLKIPPLPVTTFLKRIHGRKNENISLVKKIEDELNLLRHYVIRPIKPGSSVVLLLSGGLDSIIAWDILLNVYKVKVYPLYLKRGEDRFRREGRSVKWFSRYFKKRYPDLFIPPFTLTYLIPIPELEYLMKQPTYLHPKRVFELLETQPVDKTLRYQSQHVLPMAYPLYAAAYSHYLYEHNDISIRTIINGILPSDGVGVTFQSFTGMRLAMLMLTQTTPFVDWQYFSLFFEKNLKLWAEKSDLLHYAKKQGIPVERTWSCYYAKRRQCGECLSCKGRRYYFFRAGLVDRTKYLSDFELSKIFIPVMKFEKRIRGKISKILRGILKK